MAHTLIYCHDHLLMQNHFSFKNKNTKQKMFSSFTFSYPLTFYLWSELFRVEKEQEMQKRTKTGFGGLQRVQFKFVIPHVQGNIKMLQLVQLYCQQDRFRAVPL